MKTQQVKLTLVEFFVVTGSSGEQVDKNAPRRFMVDRVENSTEWQIGAILTKKEVDLIIEEGTKVVIKGAV